MVYTNEKIGEMSFDEWLEYKKEQEKRITHGAERVHDDVLYALEFAVSTVCFGDTLPFIHLFYIPPELDNGANAMFGNELVLIMVNKSFWDAHGIDHETISMMFHEMCHAFCFYENIKGTDGKYHLPAFKQVCEEHGGTCTFTNDTVGYNEARPTPETEELIRKELRRRGHSA